MSNQNNKPTVITVKGVTYNFPSVPKPTIEQKLASLPPTPTHSIKNIPSKMPDIKTLREQANAREIAEAFKPRPQLEQNLAEARRREEAMREAQEKARIEEQAKREAQEKADEAELYAEFAKLEKEYPNNCKKDKDGKCTIMGGVKKTRKGRKGRKGNKKSKKRSRKSKRRH
jgi:hypothetical protein